MVLRERTSTLKVLLKQLRWPPPSWDLPWLGRIRINGRRPRIVRRHQRRLTYPLWPLLCPIYPHFRHTFKSHSLDAEIRCYIERSHSTLYPFIRIVDLVRTRHPFAPLHPRCKIRSIRSSSVHIFLLAFDSTLKPHRRNGWRNRSRLSQEVILPSLRPRRRFETYPRLPTSSTSPHPGVRSYRTEKAFSSVGFGECILRVGCTTGFTE